MSNLHCLLKNRQNVIIVVEKLNELKLITKIARKYNISPSIGIRVNSQVREVANGKNRVVTRANSD